MDETPSRPSGIPRPSRLPIPRPTSANPKPASTIARPSSIIRPSPSRDNLVGNGELRNPKLRVSASRDQLRVAGTTETRTSRLRASVSREQLQQTPTRPKSRPPVSATNNGRNLVTPSSRRVSAAYEERTPPREVVEPDQDLPETEQVLFKRRLTLTRRPSDNFGPPSLEEENESAITGEAEMAPTAKGHAAVEPSLPRSAKPRQSLSERTMETLAQIPSSPAMNRKPSAFFDQQGRPRSRAGSTHSRPSSSHASDVSGRLSFSRPGSSGRDDLSSFRSSISAYRSGLSTIEGTPRAKSTTVPPSKTPTLRKTPSRASLAGSSKVSLSSTPTLVDNRSPSPERKAYAMLPPKLGSKTISGRPLKSRNSVNGLFKKPSLPAISRAAAKGAQLIDPAIKPADAAWDGTIPTMASTPKKVVDETVESPSSARKSSAALRDQIAKAKAAKRAEMQTSVVEETIVGDRTPIIPSDGGFDFGVAHDDPFNARKGENPKQKVLSQRISQGRTSGKLNIAALDLKEIPAEVTKMYDLESVTALGGNWAESVDLTRLIAADNELEQLDDLMFPDHNSNNFNPDDAAQGSIFTGLQTCDLHNNLLIEVPLGFRQLSHLTSLNLSNNRLANRSIEIISQMNSLRDLKLANNLFYGPIGWELSNLCNLEILDLHNNNISALPQNVDKMSRLRILNLSENSFESLSFDTLGKLPLTELVLKKNKLSGTLIEDPIEALPYIQTLDASLNQLTRLVPLGSAIDLPALSVLSLSMNRLQGLPDMTSWVNLLTLTVDENSISAIPNSFFSLDKLRHADFSSNDIRVIPPEIARMNNLSMIRLSGNPLRDKKFAAMSTEELKDVLAVRLEPPPPYQMSGIVAEAQVPTFIADAKASDLESRSHDDHGDDSRSDMDDFATPPTSAPQSPVRSRSQTASSLRSRSQTLSTQTWPVKPGGILDRSRTESSSLHPVVCSKVAAEHQVRDVQLHHNLFAGLPNSLSFFAVTLVSLNMANNELVGEAYVTEDMEFPSLKELNLQSNRITGLDPLTRHLRAPNLEKLDISVNRINVLPFNIREAFPKLSVLNFAGNQINKLDPDMIRGVKFVDASSNEISRLDPRLGLLGGPGGLEKLDVMGNRFRVPRWNVLERGTEATLRWLRGRVPIAEMAVWREVTGTDECLDDVD